MNFKRPSMITILVICGIILLILAIIIVIMNVNQNEETIKNTDNIEKIASISRR